MSAIDTLSNAIQLIQVRQAEAPTFELYKSIDGQLRYLQQVISGETKDRSHLKDVVVGAYAVKEFEEADPELARVLKEVQLIASRMAKGLKVL